MNTVVHFWLVFQSDLYCLAFIFFLSSPVHCYCAFYNVNKFCEDMNWFWFGEFHSILMFFIISVVTWTNRKFFSQNNAFLSFFTSFWGTIEIILAVVLKHTISCYRFHWWTLPLDRSQFIIQRIYIVLHLYIFLNQELFGLKIKERYFKN